MKKKHLYATVILLSFLAVGMQPANAIIILNESGWSDPTVGTWNPDTKTAVLMQDVSQTIQIEISGLSDEQNVILNGNGHTVYLGDTSSTGVSLAGRHYVTVQNINVTGSIMQGSGITLNPSGYCNVINNTISDCQYGIFMSDAGTCTIEGNTISNNDHGILMQAPNNSLNNTLKNNTIEENNVGLEITAKAHDNTIYNNNFINIVQATVHNNSNLFNLSEGEGGGNHWSDYTGADRGDGFGDPPYLISDTYQVYDYLPLGPFPTPPTPQDEIVELIFTVEEMNLQQGIDNSLDAKLDAAFNALDDINENNDVAAINSLNAFINAVEAQRDNKITDEQATILIGKANDIINMLQAL